MSHSVPLKGSVLIIVEFAVATGRHPETKRKALSELTEFSRHHYISPFDFALYYAAVENRDMALNYLEKAYRAHDTRLVSIAGNPGLDRIRSDPQFRKIEHAVGF